MTEPELSTQPPTSAWSMYRAIVGIGALCALVIVAVYESTAARIRENEKEFLANAVAEVLPSARSTLPVALADSGRLEALAETPDLPVLLGYDTANRLVGAIIAAEGMGYQDTIRVLFAYSFERNAIVGFKVLASKETPGLGDRVETEPHFLANFDGLDARLSDDGETLRQPIVTVKQGEKTEPWQLDGITGATITSEAIGNILNASAGRWVPILERDAADLARER